MCVLGEGESSRTCQHFVNFITFRKSSHEESEVHLRYVRYSTRLLSFYRVVPEEMQFDRKKEQD